MDPQIVAGGVNNAPFLVDEHRQEAPESGSHDVALGTTMESLSSIDQSNTRETPDSIHRRPFATDGPLIAQNPPSNVRDKTQSQAPAVVSNTLPVSTQSEKHQLESQIFKNWWLEVSACLLILLSIGAIVVTLAPHKGKPLPKWRYHLSVNTVISIYVVVLKSSIVLVAAEGLGQLKWRWLQRNRPLQDLVQFDNAIRGPLGALGLLWRLRSRRPLSSIAAAISLLVLMIDPFVQQVIHYYDCVVSMEDLHATVPRTNIFLDSGSDAGKMSSRDRDFYDAVVRGILSPGKVIQAGCPTGNCSFDNFSTVAFCSRCRDISKEISIQTTFINSNYTNSTTQDNEGDTPYPNTTLIAEGYELNINTSISSSLFSGLSVINGPGLSLNLTAMTSYAQASGPNYTVEFLVGKQYENFDSFTGQPRSNCADPMTNDTWYCDGYGAARCDLYPCVRSLNSSVATGILQESDADAPEATWGGIEQSTWMFDQDNFDATPDWASNGTVNLTLGTLPKDSEPWIAMINLSCISGNDHQQLLANNYSLNQSQKWLPYNLTINPYPISSPEFPQFRGIPLDAPFPKSMLVRNCLYAFEDLFLTMVNDTFVDHIFTGTLVGDDPAKLMSGTVVQLNGSEVIKAIYDWGNVSFDSVSQVFENVSESITDYLRLKTIPMYNVPASGTVYHNQTCLGVRWPWLAFPATLALITLAFFVVMLVESRSKSFDMIPVWKSSPLALLFHGLELLNTRHLHGDGLDGMERLAKEISIRLEETDEGLKLVEVAEGGQVMRERGV